MFGYSQAESETSGLRTRIASAERELAAAWHDSESVKRRYEERLKIMGDSLARTITLLNVILMKYGEVRISDRYIESMLPGQRFETFRDEATCELVLRTIPVKLITGCQLSKER